MSHSSIPPRGRIRCAPRCSWRCSCRRPYVAISPDWTRHVRHQGRGSRRRHRGGRVAGSPWWGRRAATCSTVRGGSDAFIRRYDRAGKVLWTRQFGTGAQDLGHDVAADAGGLTVLGSTDGSFSGSGGTLGIDDLFVRRYGRDGHVKWTRQFGTVGRRGSGRDRGRRRWAVRRRDRRRGALTGTNAPRRPRRLRPPLRPPGHVEWTRQFGTTDGDFGDAVAIDGGGVSVGGGTDGDLAGTNAGPFTDAFLRRYDTAGHVRLDAPVGPGGRRPGAVGRRPIPPASPPSATRTPTRPATSRARPSSAATTARPLQWSKIFGSPDSEIAWGVASDAARADGHRLHLRRPRRQQQGQLRRLRPPLQPVGDGRLEAPVRDDEGRPRHRRRRGRQGVHDPRPHAGRARRRREGQPRRVRASLHPLATLDIEREDGTFGGRRETDLTTAADARVGVWWHGGPTARDPGAGGRS